MILKKCYFLSLAAILCFGCASNSTFKSKAPKLTLGQWTFNKELRSGAMTNQQFIRKAADLGFDGIDYVNAFFKNKVDNKPFLDSLKTTARKAGIKQVLILLDGLGELAAEEPGARKFSIDEHKKWIDAAQYLGCYGVRLNIHGKGTPEQIKDRAIASVKELQKYAATKNIQLLIENHGGISNNGDWLLSLMKELNPYAVHALPDFDNWCWERDRDDYYSGSCIKRFDRYDGMTKLMPYARAVSAKAFQFDSQGLEPNIDFYRMMDIIKASGYKGYIELEYEGEDLDASQGIALTRLLAIKAWKGRK